MNYIRLGRTELQASVAGLGCGGGSRIGIREGKDHAVRLVRRAIELGVNLFDTSHSYGTEEALGEAIKIVPRDQVIISTKHHVRGGKDAAKMVVKGLEGSLRALGTEHVDIFHLHGLSPDAYERARDRILPSLERERAKGKIRHLGVTETGPGDFGHEMLQKAFRDDLFDVVMPAFSMMNQNALTKVFPETRRLDIGTLIMFVVRRIFSEPGRLKSVMEELAARGEVPAGLAAREAPLDFLIHNDGGATSLPDAAYRYAQHTEGCHVILFGTSSLEHLEANIASITAPPLPEPDVNRIHQLFAHLEGVGLEFPRG